MDEKLQEKNKTKNWRRPETESIFGNEKHSHQKLKPNGCTYHMSTISELEDGYEYPQCSEGLKTGKYEGDFKRHGMEILKGAIRETEGETIWRDSN